MRPKILDHVALWVADRDPITDFVTERLTMHVIEKTDKFTLVGTNARRGKLTLFDAEGPRERGALKHIALRVNDLDEALGGLEGVDVARENGGAYFDVHEGLAARARRGGDRCRLRPRSRRALLREPRGDGPEVQGVRLRARGGDARRGRRRLRRVPPRRAGRSRAAAAQPSRRARRLRGRDARGGEAGRDGRRGRRRRARTRSRSSSGGPSA